MEGMEPPWAADGGRSLCAHLFRCGLVPRDTGRVRCGPMGVGVGEGPRPLVARERNPPLQRRGPFARSPAAQTVSRRWSPHGAHKPRHAALGSTLGGTRGALRRGYSRGILLGLLSGTHLGFICPELWFGFLFIRARNKFPRYTHGTEYYCSSTGKKNAPSQVSDPNLSSDALKTPGDGAE